MTVDELRDRLNVLPGDATVRLWCDHGQASMLATTVSIQHFRASERGMWMTDDGQEEVDNEHPANVVEIGSP